MWTIKVCSKKSHCNLSNSCWDIFAVDQQILPNLWSTCMKKILKNEQSRAVKYFHWLCKGVDVFMQMAASLSKIYCTLLHLLKVIHHMLTLHDTFVSKNIFAHSAEQSRNIKNRWIACGSGRTTERWLALQILLGLNCNEHHERPMWPAELAASCASDPLQRGATFKFVIKTA